MVKEEFKHMGEHKLLIATICAIMIIPFLYSVFFLKSVWDPYGNSGSLPVAVVNEDQTVAYNGKKMKVGEDLVKKLKKNDDLDWHFVSAKQAKYGISHKKYYMVVTIPKNFSKNATTVLDKTPKKMQLKYKTNDSLNYIGKVISEEGVKQLNAEVRKSVSTAYAKTMFATIKKVGKGFSTAAKGADKLKTGSNTLTDGINTYTAGVKKVNDGVIELQTGVVPLSSGVLKLTTGATALSSGVQEYTAGVDKVNTGTQKLNSSTGTLATGVGKLASGSNSLASGVYSYTSGVTKVNSGVQTLNGSTGTLATGVGKLASGSNSLSSGVNSYTSGVSELTKGLSKLDSNSATLNSSLSNMSELPSAAAGLYVLNSVLNAGLSQINVSTLTGMSTSMANVQKQMVAIKSLEAQLEPNLAALQQLATESQEISKQISAVSTAQTAFSVSLKSDLTDIGTNTNTSATNAAEVLATLKESGNTDTSTLSMEQKLQKIINASQDTGRKVTDIQNKATAFQTSMTNVGDSLNKLQSGVNNLSSAEGQLTELLRESNELMSSSDGLTNEEAQKKIQTLVEGVKNLQTLAANATNISSQLNNNVNTSKANQKLDLSAINNSANQGESAVNSEINSQVSNMSSLSNLPSLLSGVEAYTNGVSSAYSGSKKLSSNSSQLISGASQLSSGLTTLNGKVPALTSGVSQLASGTSQLVANNSALNSGAAQLSSGLGTLNSNVPTLVSGVSQLVSGTQTLSNNSSTLNSGASQLASGLTTLNNKVPTLTSGVNQLASGTSQLAANSDKLSTGSAKLTTGNKALAKALNKGAKQVNAVKTSNKTANMFAAPSNLKHSNYSKVPNYGYALAPYMLSVALFVGSLVFNLVYPIRRMSSDGTGTEWFLSKVSVGFLVATGNALIETIFMMVFGLVPMHLPSMIINALFFSYSAMFLIMFMSMLGNNPGRFLAMILLVIQLGACGGSFPIQITNGMNGFFQAINPFLPMTYSVLGFRQALNSGLGEHQVIVSVGVLSVFIIVCLFLLWLTMTTFVKKGIVTYEENKPDSNYPGN